MRRARIALLAIVLVGVAGVALVASWTHEPPFASTSAATTIAEEPPAAATRPSVVEEEVAADAVPPARPEPSPEPARPARVERSARKGASTTTQSSLVSLRREMRQGFASLQRRVARCGATDAWFRLDVETTDGGVRVIDVHLEFPGSAGVASVACVRSLLVGETVPVPSAKPGRRWEMSLAPGSRL